MYKKRDARAKLLFCRQSKPIAFLPFSLPSPSSMFKLPDVKDGAFMVEERYVCWYEAER